MGKRTKICITCNRELDLNDENFFKRKDSKDGYRNDCKECRKKVRAKNYEANKEQELETNRKYREANKEKIAIRNREYKRENKEKIQEYLEKTRKKTKRKSRKTLGS
ncbi:hypothetical protein CMV37_03510 [Bacillus cereus]|nr:hypothetical protein CMV37_03510 [Bacillus cereus]